MEEFPSYLVGGINSPRQARGREELQVRLEGRKWFGISHVCPRWVLQEGVQESELSNSLWLPAAHPKVPKLHGKEQLSLCAAALVGAAGAGGAEQ